MNRFRRVVVAGLLVAGCTGGDEETAPTTAGTGVVTDASGVPVEGTVTTETTEPTEPTESTTARSTGEPAPPAAPPIAALSIEPVFDVADRWLGSAWSPDGASIVALEGRPGPNGATFAIVRMDPTGTVVQQTPFDHRFTGLFPELVGPDGSELLFSSGPSGCTMQPFDLVSFTLGAALPLPRDL